MDTREKLIVCQLAVHMRGWVTNKNKLEAYGFKESVSSQRLRVQHSELLDGFIHRFGDEVRQTLQDR